jgi:CheY-like chemotaxis protein
MKARTPRILLVDDDRMIRRMYRDFLEADGNEVVAESAAVDALERLQNGEVFNLVVTDVMMARMDGWELLRAIREDLGFGELELPVIVVSAHFDSDTLRVEAFRCGANSTYTKAQPLSALLQEVRVQTGRQRSKFDDDTIPD